MRRGERIPLHDHSNDDAGGIVATTRARLIAQSASSTPGDVGGGSGGGGGSTTDAELTLQLVEASGSAVEIDWSYDVTDITLTDDCTYTFVNLPDSGTPTPHLLIRRMGAGGPFDETFPAETQWDDGTGLPGGDPQTLNTAEDSRTTCVLFTEDAGTTVGASFGSTAGGGTVTEDDIRDAGRWEVVVSGTGPPVAVSTPDDDDWVYAWVPG